MRISTDKSDPGYINAPFKYGVYLNGKRLYSCIMADEELGEVRVYLKDSDNLLYIDEVTRDLALKLLLVK